MSHSDNDVAGSISPPTSDDDGNHSIASNGTNTNDTCNGNEKVLLHSIQEEMYVLLAAHPRKSMKSLTDVCADALWQSIMFLDVKSLIRLSLASKYMRGVAGSDNSSAQVLVNEWHTRHRTNAYVLEPFERLKQVSDTDLSLRVLFYGHSEEETMAEGFPGNQSKLMALQRVLTIALKEHWTGAVAWACAGAMIAASVNNAPVVKMLLEWRVKSGEGDDYQSSCEESDDDDNTDNRASGNRASVNEVGRRLGESNHTSTKTVSNVDESDAYLINEHAAARRVLFACVTCGNLSALRAAAHALLTSSTFGGGQISTNNNNNNNNDNNNNMIRNEELSRVTLLDLETALRLGARQGHIGATAYMFALITKHVGVLVSASLLTEDAGERAVCGALLRTFQDAALSAHVKLTKDLGALLCSRQRIARACVQVSSETETGAVIDTLAGVNGVVGSTSAATPGVGYGAVAGLGDVNLGVGGEEEEEEEDELANHVAAILVRVLEQLSRDGKVEVATAVVTARVSNVLTVNDWDAVLACAAANGRAKIIECMLTSGRVTELSLMNALTNGVRRGFVESTAVLLCSDVVFPPANIDACVQQASLRGHDEVLALLEWYKEGQVAAREPLI